MASIGEIAAEVRAALGAVAVGRAQLTAGLHSIDAAGEAYAQLGTGSSQPDLPMVAAQARQSAEQIRQVIAILDQATTAAEHYLAKIVGPAPPTEQSRPDRQRDTNHQIDRLRRELPPPITAAQRGTGRRTHGRWFGSDGVVHSVVSCIDEWSDYGDKVFEPCQDRLSCARLLPVMLPQGCSLTIHAPNYRRTFTGGMTL